MFNKHTAKDELLKIGLTFEMSNLEMKENTMVDLYIERYVNEKVKKGVNIYEHLFGGLAVKRN